MRIGLLIILLASVAFIGCSGNKTPNINTNGNANRTVFTPPGPLSSNSRFDPDFKPCNEYYPLVPGSVAKYVLNYSSGLVADVTVVVDSEEVNGRKGFIERMRVVDRTGGLQIVQDSERHFVCDGDKVVIVMEKSESRVAEQPKSTSQFDYRENSYMMIEPSSLAQINTTWTYGFKRTMQRGDEPQSKEDAPIIVSFTVKGEQEVTLPTGKVKALKIERKGTNIVTDYYTRGLGLVKRDSAEGTTWELKEYSGLKPIE
ncbi:MAG: hypothetical protein WBV94_30495 [Blastocatellia bacterium]